MKFLDRLALAVFSIIVFVLAVLLCLMMFGWFDAELIISALNYLKANEIATNVTVGISVVLILLALKAMFFESYSKEDNSKEGILLENNNGKLVVSRDTLENLTNSVSRAINGVESVVSRVILDKENHLIIFINLLVNPDAMIKDLSSGLQEKVKQTVKDSLGLDVKEVNIKIKNITNETIPKSGKSEKSEKVEKNEKSENSENSENSEKNKEEVVKSEN